MKKKRKKFIIKLVLSAAIAVCLFAAAFYNGLIVRDYRLETDKLSKSIRLAVVADLHNCGFGENQSDLINKIKKQNPDIVMLVGDIFVKPNPDSNAISLIDGIAQQYPCFYVSGNHEYWGGEAQAKKQMCRDNGIEVLDGQTKEIMVNGQRINICGVDDPAAGLSVFYRQMNAVAAVDKTNYTILLSHRPEFADEYKKLGVDLILSGHSHGGQWRIPFLVNGFFAPDQGWFPAYAGGLYEHGESTQIVSRGLAKLKNFPRIFNPPELVIIDIEPK